MLAACLVAAHTMRRASASHPAVWLLAEYVHACAHDEEEVAEVRDLATKTWHAMKRTAKAGQRRTLPDMQVRGGLRSRLMCMAWCTNPARRRCTCAAQAADKHACPRPAARRRLMRCSRATSRTAWSTSWTRRLRSCRCGWGAVCLDVAARVCAADTTCAAAR